MANILNSDFIKNKEEEKKRFLSYVGSGKEVIRVAGLLGEWFGCDAYAEMPPIQDEGRGAYLKVFGCSYLFAGFPNRVQVMGLATAKYIFSGFLTGVVAKSWIYLLAVGFKFLFFRKRFFYDLDRIAHEIKYRVVHIFGIPEENFNIPVSELRRAWAKAVDDVFKIQYWTHEWEVYAENYKTITEPLAFEKVKSEKLNPMGYFLARIAYFLFLFIEMDSAYRFRVQDAISNDPFKTLDTLISRNTRHGEDVSNKFRLIKIALRMALVVSPKLKDFVYKFFNEIDIKKVELSEADKYFTLQYISYNFGGKSVQERFAERKRIDKKKKHSFLIGFPSYDLREAEEMSKIAYKGRDVPEMYTPDDAEADSS